MSTDSTLRPPELIIGEPRVSLLVYGPDHAQIVQLDPGSAVVVGRAPPADVVVPDRSVSRRHARFERRGAEVCVDDLGSSNGTLVNDQRVESAVLGPGDRVSLGSVTITVHVMGSRSEWDLDSHERFLTQLEDQVRQGKYFGRGFALLMVRDRSAGEPVATLYPRLRGLLRPVDRVGRYGPASLLVRLPEMERDEAIALAERMVAAQAAEGGQLTCGIALFPQAGTSVEQLLEVSRVAEQRASPESPVHCAGAEDRTGDEQAPVVHSPAMRALFAMAERLGRSSIPVLIEGATGAGKEVLARAIHEHSERRSKPLRCINCGAIPTQLMESALFGHERGAFTGADRRVKGIFEEADGSSLLLDEIGELSAGAQAALLRVLETKQICRVGSSQEIAVEVRVMAATHCNLEEMCQAGRFRSDLLYRLNAMTLRVPQLCERPEDIVPLATHFLRLACSNSGRPIGAISPRALELLTRYSWPGNVRELHNVIERAVVVAQGDVITEDDLSDRLRAAPAPAPAAEAPAAEAPAGSGQELPRPGGNEISEDERGEAKPEEPGDDTGFRARVRQFEESLILDALEASGWNHSEAARRIGMPLRTMSHKIKVYGLKPGSR